MVVDDSHINRFQRNLFNNSFETAKRYIKLFSSKKSHNFKHYVIPSIVYQKADVVVYKSFASEKNTGKIMIIGDIHIKRIQRKLLNNSFETIKHYIKLLSGAKFTSRTKAEVAVIYMTDNNIIFKNAETLAENNVNAGKQCSDYGVVNIAISPILVKKSIKLSAIT